MTIRVPAMDDWNVADEEVRPFCPGSWPPVNVSFSYITERAALFFVRTAIYIQPGAERIRMVSVSRSQYATI